MQNNKLSEVKGKELVAAGHAFAKAIGMDTPLIEIAKMVSELAGRLDVALVRCDELQQKLDALAAENAEIRAIVEGHAAGFKVCPRCSHEDECETDDVVWMARKATPATYAYLNSVRAEGIHFAANRILAAWKSCLIKATPAEAADVSGAVLSALEFLPKANPEEFKRDYADQVRADIAELLRAGKDGE